MSFGAISDDFMSDRNQPSLPQHDDWCESGGDHNNIIASFD
jgi:hypothetical protein